MTTQQNTFPSEDTTKLQKYVHEGPIDANVLEALAKERPGEILLNSQGILTLLGGIRQLEAEIRQLKAAPQVEPQQPRTDEELALDLLAHLFDAYEGGVQCYEDPEGLTGFIGHAFRLDNDTFHACADLLNRRRPVQHQSARKVPAAEQPADAVDSDVRKALHRVLVLQGLHRDSPTYQRAIAAGRELLGLPADSSAAPQGEPESFGDLLTISGLRDYIPTHDLAHLSAAIRFSDLRHEALLKARAAPTQVDAGVSREYVLRAMSRNYTAGHVWDHLDADACAKGADEIKQLRAALAAQGGQEAEPGLYVSPGQLEKHHDRDDESGGYLPARKTPKGMFTQPLYTHTPRTQGDALPTIKGAGIQGGYVVVTPAGWDTDKARAVRDAILRLFPVDPAYTPRPDAAIARQGGKGGEA